jgi:L-alanine-DL-glutamate epimerase-like enolase superfamily enzyme
LNLPLAALLGKARDVVPVYGSGGFTAYAREQLQQQLCGWASEGIGAVKMKIGTFPEPDVDRVAKAREAIGDGVRLMVDANGAYARKQALEKAQEFR